MLGHRMAHHHIRQARLGCYRLYRVVSVSALFAIYVYMYVVYMCMHVLCIYWQTSRYYYEKMQHITASTLGGARVLRPSIKQSQLLALLKHVLYFQLKCSLCMNTTAKTTMYRWWMIDQEKWWFVCLLRGNQLFWGSGMDGNTVVKIGLGSTHFDSHSKSMQQFIRPHSNDMQTNNLQYR